MQQLITLSSKGQIVIPKKVRDDAGLKPGDQFFVKWNRNQLELKKIDEQKEQPKASLVQELLGKYRTNDEESTSVRPFRENLYGKIDD